MFFKRAPKNRRIGREFVLDVKLRSSQVRARRMRTAALLLGGFFLAVGSVYLAWRATEGALDLLLYRNPAFALLNVDVQTDGMIASDQVRRWAGVRLGENLFALDLGGVRRNLQMVSMIEFVSLEKILPHTLHLQVTEREPVAQVSIMRPGARGGVEVAPLYLDYQGYVILPLTPAQCSPAAVQPGVDQLPSITGITANEVQPGRQVESLQLRAALDLILAFQRSPMQGLADIAKIDVSSADVLVVKTGQGSEITFGLTGLDQQLLRWQSISNEAQRMSKAIATLDLAVSNSIPVTWMEGGAVPQVPVKISKPLRNKKKHV
jgi:cell division protein FtsQ